ncbi:MAG: hypothetical protein ACRDUV_22455 [Pseudonocardiaceae bacterium]
MEDRPAARVRPGLVLPPSIRRLRDVLFNQVVVVAERTREIR